MKWYFAALALRKVYVSNYHHLRKEITGRAAAAAAAGIFIYFLPHESCNVVGNAIEPGSDLWFMMD